MGITAELAQFTADIRLDRLPPEVVTRARFLVLDLVGNIVRARHDAESTPSFLAAARAMGMAAGNSGVFGDAARYTPAGAAFLNGALAHSLDFDDTHAAGIAASRRAGDPGGAGGGEMVGRLGRRRAGRHRRRLRGHLPRRARAAGRRALRPRLPPHRHLRRVRRGGGGGAGVRAVRRAGRGRARHRAEPVRRQPAVPGQRRLDQALPGRLGGAATA